MSRISQASADRIAAAVRKMERQPEGSPSAPPSQQGTPKAWIRITSTSTTPITLADATTPAAYPGKWVMPTDHATDGGDVYVFDANGVALATGKFYEARLREYAGSPSQPVYETDRDAGGTTDAPVDAQYIVAASNATLTAERVATNTTTVTWDFGTAGQAKANVPSASLTAPGAVNLVDQVLGDGAKTVGSLISRGYVKLVYDGSPNTQLIFNRGSFNEAQFFHYTDFIGDSDTYTSWGFLPASTRFFITKIVDGVVTVSATGASGSDSVGNSFEGGLCTGVGSGSGFSGTL